MCYYTLRIVTNVSSYTQHTFYLSLTFSIPIPLTLFSPFKPFSFPFPVKLPLFLIVNSLCYVFCVLRIFSPPSYDLLPPLSRLNHSPPSSSCLTLVDWHKLLSVVFTISYYAGNVRRRNSWLNNMQYTFPAIVFFPLIDLNSSDVLQISRYYIYIYIYAYIVGLYLLYTLEVGLYIFSLDIKVLALALFVGKS